MRDPIEFIAKLSYHCIAAGYYEIKFFIIWCWLKIKHPLIRPMTEAEKRTWDDIMRRRRR